MLKACKYCGQQYNGCPGSSACPECADKVKRNTVLPRVCRECGRTFPGGPRAWFCPGCRAERRKAQNAEHYRRGTSRPLGSTDKCVVCGADYVVSNARQKYCPSCAAEAVREKDRSQSLDWSKKNTTPARRREVRNNSTAEIPCCICGKMFKPTYSSKTCSKACSVELARRNAAAWEKGKKGYRKAYRREYYQKKRKE